MKPLSIYIHIPFCVRKCRYCDFLSAPAGKEEQRLYMDALLREITEKSQNYVNHEIHTVFIGGGTPSIPEPDIIIKILSKLREKIAFINIDKKDNTPEITIEGNPGTLSYEKLRTYRKAGINRLSIGLQSSNDEELRTLGRIHKWEDFIQVYGDARKAGFANINVDIMSGLPGQNLSSYGDTLKKVIQLQPEHISAYSLIIEEGTPFYQLYGNNLKIPPGTPLLPTEEEERLMYELTGSYLEEHDYHRYEISNYAREGYECRHNKVYWERGNYVGFGLGAASMVDNVRWSNDHKIEHYVNQYLYAEENAVISEQRLSVTEQMEEFMFLGLRLTKGVSREDFYRYFHKNIEEIYGEILTRLKEESLIETGEYIRLTPYGRDISNYIMSQFLL